MKDVTTPTREPKSGSVQRLLAIAFVAFVVVLIGAYLVGPAWIEAPALKFAASVPPAQTVEGVLPEPIEKFWTVIDLQTFDADDHRRLAFDLSGAETRDVELLLSIASAKAAPFVRKVIGEYESGLRDPKMWSQLQPAPPWEFDYTSSELPAYLIAAGSLDRLVSASLWATSSDDLEHQESMRDIWAASTYGMVHSNSTVELFLTLSARQRAIRMWSHLARVAPPGPDDLRPLPLDHSFRDLLLDAIRGDQTATIELLRDLDAADFGVEMSSWDVAFARVALARSYRAYGKVIERIESGSTDGLAAIFAREAASGTFSSDVVDSMLAAVFDQIPELEKMHAANEGLLAVLLDAHAGRPVVIDPPLQRVVLEDGTVIVFDASAAPAPDAAGSVLDQFLSEDGDSMVVLP